MNRLIPLSFAALFAGLTFTAVSARAANPYEASSAYPAAPYAGANGSQVTLVSATEEQPQAADPSSVRLADPRGGSVPMQQPTAQAAPKPAAKQATAPQPLKSVAKSPRQAAAPARQPPPRPLASAQRPGAAPPRQLAPTYYPRQNRVELTAQVSVEPNRSEAVIRPAAPMATEPTATMSASSEPPSPEMEASTDGGPSCPSCCCDTCCGFCAGIEYLFLRPHFNDDEAFLRMTTTTTATTATQTNQLINFDEPYASDYHFFLGYHTACGEEFRFGFWHIADDGNRSGTASGDFLAGAGTAFQGPGTTELTAAGETITGTTHMTLNMYDVDDVKRIDLPSLGCDCCPQWEVKWSYGLRIVDFRHTLDEFTPFESVYNEAAFAGAGPKLGIEVRRQIGHTKLSAYVSATAAMLLGEQRARSTTTTPGVLQTAVSENEASAMRKIPDVNISVGLEWQPWCHTTLTAGWMFEDFGDLGAPTCVNCNAPTGTIGSGDLSFDGLFVRAEHCF